MREIRKIWAESKTYRVVLIVAIVYVTLRLATQVYLALDTFNSEAISSGQQVSSDLQIYVNAAHHFQQKEDLYLKGSLEILEQHYPYSPAFAFMFMPILLIPLSILVWIAIALHIAAYIILYIWWGRIFRQNRLVRAGQLWAMMLPMYLVFSAFWDDLTYLNIYIIIALFTTLFIDAVLQETLGWAIFWLCVIILPIKPHWAFAAVIPLLLGRYRFFARLIGGTILAYLAVMGITILVGGIQYGVHQYQDYVVFLERLSRDFPWRGPDDPFLGYNHSIMQIILYFFGISSINATIATIIKVVLLLPLAAVAIRLIRYPVGKAGYEVPQIALELAFSFYLGGFIWLDMVWEVVLVIVSFGLFLSSLEQKWKKILIWVVFFPYAIVDAWRLISYMIFGDSIIYQGSYVLTDPLTYIPVIMIVLLVFYGLLVERLWKMEGVY